MSVCAVWASVTGECVFRVSALSGPPPSLFTTVNFARFASSQPSSFCLLWSTIMASSQAERLSKDDNSFPSFISFLDRNSSSLRLLLRWRELSGDAFFGGFVALQELQHRFTKTPFTVFPKLQEGSPKPFPRRKAEATASGTSIKTSSLNFKPGISLLVVHVCRSRFRRAAKLTPHRPVLPDMFLAYQAVWCCILLFLCTLAVIGQKSLNCHVPKGGLCCL